MEAGAILLARIGNATFNHPLCDIESSIVDSIQCRDFLGPSQSSDPKHAKVGQRPGFGASAGWWDLRWLAKWGPVTGPVKSALAVEDIRAAEIQSDELLPVGEGIFRRGGHAVLDFAHRVRKPCCVHLVMDFGKPVKRVRVGRI